MSDLNITVNLITKAAKVQAKALEDKIKRLELGLVKTGKQGKKSVGLLARAFGGLKATVKTVGKTLVAFFVVNKIREGILEVINFTLRFEDALVGVGKVLNITGTELADFGVEIKALSSTIPVAADKLLDIAQVAARLGVRGSDNIIKFTDTIAKLAAVSDLEGGRAALVLARLLNITGESVGTVDKLGSAIVRLGNNFAASESEIADVALDIARGTARFNISSKNILGIAVALKETGAQSEISGSQIGFLFGEITKALNSGGPKLAEFSRITGKTAEELAHLIDNDPTEILLELTNGLRSLGGSATETEAALNDLGLNNLRIKKVLPSLVKNYDNFRSALKQTSDEYKKNNELNRVAEKAFSTLSSKAKTLGNTLLTIGEGLLSTFVPALTKVVSGLNFILKPLASASTLFVKMAQAMGEMAAKAEIAFGGSVIQKNLLKWDNRAKAIGRTIAKLNEEIAQNTDFMAKNDKAGVSNKVAGRYEKQLELVLKLNEATAKRNILLDKQGKLDRNGNEEGSEGALALKAEDERLKKMSALRKLAAKNEVDDKVALADIGIEQIIETGKKENAVREQITEQQKQDREASFFESDEQKKTRDEADITRLRDKFEKELLAERKIELDKITNKDLKDKALRKLSADADKKAKSVKSQSNEKLEKDEAAHQNNLSVLAKAGSKEALAIQRAQTIKSIIIKTPDAISNAFTYGSGVGGPVLGFAFGAIAAAAQAQQLKTASNLSFQEGGVVPGNSFSGDNIAANVNSGEVILNRQQQANTLFAISNGGGSNGQQQPQEIVSNITIELDGEVVGQTVSRQVANGLVLGENE